jgi:uncharacterized protein YqfA (UPF0365 family)
MKKIIGLAVFTLIIISACTEKKSPLTGIWKLQEVEINGSKLDFEDLGMPYLEFNNKGGYLLSMSGIDEKGNYTFKDDKLTLSSSVKDKTSQILIVDKIDSNEVRYHSQTELWILPIPLWLSAKFANVHVSLIQLVFMRFRRVPPSTIVNALVTATKAGIDVQRDMLEAHYLAGGNVPKVIRALISADKANIDLDFKAATAIDLAGRDVFEAVQLSVNPKVIESPPVTAVAKDGIQLITKARVTVRANMRQFVGGAGEETVLARVGEGIVTSIGSAESHKSVMENPDSISKVVLAKGLDAGTAFEILSIDIADIDIGKNIGASLQMDQANADKNIAQAKAEERRAMAIALEQEMKAKAQEARAKVIEAEAQIPIAISEAFRSGIWVFWTTIKCKIYSRIRKCVMQFLKEVLEIKNKFLYSHP